jgi:hypothetical protein
MAKRSSTARIRRRRKGDSHKRMQSSRNARVAKDSSESNPFEDFGGERTGLMKAAAVLDCLSDSLNHSCWDRSTYAMAVDAARDLVQESMDRLERRDRQIESCRRLRVKQSR